jgi:hypothetical protein
VLTEGLGQTSYAVITALSDNTRYYWRARAGDAKGVSAWMEGEFFVNTANDAPGAFVPSAPSDGIEVTILAPVLEVTNSTDIDGDTLTYGFDVYEDDTLTTLVASSPQVAEGPGGTTTWTVDTALSSNNWYWWVATVTDEHGAQTQTATASFKVRTGNTAPTEPGIVAPALAGEVLSGDVNFEITNAIDADGDDIEYYYEVDTALTFDTPNLIVPSKPVANKNPTVWSVTGLMDNTQYFWRVLSSDMVTDSAWVNGSFLVNAANDAPDLPTVKNPGDGAWVPTLTPLLELHTASDIDLDDVLYEFELFDDVALTSLVDSGATSVPNWSVSATLTDNSWYYWRARSVDGHGLQSAWLTGASFFVNNDGVDDQPLISLVEPSSVQGLNEGKFDVRWSDTDPDSNATVALYYDDNNAGEDGVLIFDGIEEDPDGLGDTYGWNIDAMAAGEYWLYATITDALTTTSAYAGYPIQVKMDVDSDGYLYDVDCNDNDSSIYPGAVEAIRDGIDQDCNDYDMTIEVDTASYKLNGEELAVVATSLYGAGANLVVEGYGAMIYDSQKDEWELVVTGIGAHPATINIVGAEGTLSYVPVD